jgi:hypothetical protein
MENIRNWLIAHKLTAGLAIFIFLFASGSLFAFQKISQPSGPLPEIDLPFDAEGPYARIYPRKDGNAIILELERTSSYDHISYELAYTSFSDEKVVEGGKIVDNQILSNSRIDRGVVGTIDTTDKKGSYEQEILFGTCSKNVCKYDQGVENGTLTLHIKKGNKSFKMITQWHLQKPDVALGQLTSADEHFNYKMNNDRETLANVGFSITNDLTGVPKLPNEKSVLGKVYALNVPIGKSLSTGEITYELSERAPENAKIYVFYGATNAWQELDTKVNNNKLTAAANDSGIFAVLISKK